VLQWTSWAATWPITADLSLLATTMPKRKKSGKKAPADFEKKKSKVGKVTTRDNHTSTEFKSRSILIRTQKAARCVSVGAVHVLGYP
jgi:hypothetical protein